MLVVILLVLAFATIMMPIYVMMIYYKMDKIHRMLWHLIRLKEKEHGISD